MSQTQLPVNRLTDQETAAWIWATRQALSGLDGLELLQAQCEAWNDATNPRRPRGTQAHRVLMKFAQSIYKRISGVTMQVEDGRLAPRYE